MKRSIFSGLARMLSLLLATGVWVLVVARANGQQEVSPTWYPWPAAKKDVPQSSTTRGASKHRAAGRSVLRPLSQSPGKHGVKHPSISVAVCQEEGLASERCRGISRLPEDAIQERFEVKNTSRTGLHKTKL
jgi:hypothetical protein